MKQLPEGQRPHPGPKASRQRWGKAGAGEVLSQERLGLVSIKKSSFTRGRNNAGEGKCHVSHGLGWGR